MSRTVPYGVISHLRSMFLGYATRFPRPAPETFGLEKTLLGRDVLWELCTYWYVVPLKIWHF